MTWARLLRWAHRTSVRIRLKSSLEHAKSPAAGESEWTTMLSSDSTSGGAPAAGAERSTCR